MKDPVSIFGMWLILTGGDAAQVASLCCVLRQPISWESFVPESIPNNVRVWKAVAGDWQLLLVDFDVSEQEGHKSGDRGQNVTMTHRKSGLVIMSDGIVQHQLAHWLLERMEQGDTGKNDVQ